MGQEIFTTEHRNQRPGDSVRDILHLVLVTVGFSLPRQIAGEESIPAESRDSVHVEVRDALTDLVIDRDVTAVGSQGLFRGQRHLLRQNQQAGKGIAVELHERRRMSGRNDQAMPMIEWPAVQKDPVGGTPVNDDCMSGTSQDGAKNTPFGAVKQLDLFRHGGSSRYRGLPAGSRRKRPPGDRRP